MRAALALATAAGVAASGVPSQTLANGVAMPRLSLGVFQYNDTEAQDAVVAAFQNGFSMVDCGEQYKNNRGVGRGLKELLDKKLVQRGNIFVQAKVDGCGFDGIELGKCYEDTKNMLEQQLVELDVTYVDSAIIHFPPLPDMAAGGCDLGICKLVQSQWRAMQEFYKANKTRAVGVSNYCKNCYACLEGVEEFDVMPHIHQIQYHLGMGTDNLGYVSFAKEKGMAIQAYSTLANKPEWYKWEPRGSNPQILSGKAFDGKLGEIAKAHNVSTIQVALKWVVEQGFTALTKSGNPKHLQSDSDLWSFDLAAEEMAVLNTEVPAWPASGADHGLHGIPAWACHPPGSIPGLGAEGEDDALPEFVV